MVALSKEQRKEVEREYSKIMNMAIKAGVSYEDIIDEIGTKDEIDMIDYKSMKDIRNSIKDFKKRAQLSLSKRENVPISRLKKGGSVKASKYSKGGGVRKSKYSL